MIRRRQNFVGGLTTDNPLSDSATTLNSAELNGLIAISAPLEYLAITLDPYGENGAPEIIWVSAHTSSATSATVSRGEEDTVAREHPVGTLWVHAGTVMDFVTIVNTDGDTGTKIFIGTVDPEVDYTPVDGDIWFDTEVV